MEVRGRRRPGRHPRGRPHRVLPDAVGRRERLGEEWRTLLDHGVDAVRLLEHDAEVYGPMSLRPAQ
nr:hypothetical protein [Angustibacter aerolatus]